MKMTTAYSAEQIEKRVQELAAQISADYAGRTIHAVGVMENSFIFMADLVRKLESPVMCQFVKPTSMEKIENNITTTEIRFTPEMDVAGRDVLLIEGIIQSGVTTDFLVRTLLTRGAKSVKIAVLVDRHMERRLALQPDYCGFLHAGGRIVGYGLSGDGMSHRALPYLASLD